jgi:hypothetical protein
MAEQQTPQMRTSDRNLLLFGNRITKDGQLKAYAQAEATAAKRKAAIDAGYTPPTAAATGDLLKRRLELFKGMQAAGPEKAADLYSEAEGLGISRSGFRQALNRITKEATPVVAATTTTPPAATTTTPPAGTATTTPPAGTATTTPPVAAVTPDIPPVIVTPKNDADRANAEAYGMPTTPLAAVTPAITDPNSREAQVATMLKTIASESGKGESNADILRRLNEQRVLQGKAPLRIKVTEPKTFPVDEGLTNALFSGMLFKPNTLQ